MNQTIQEKVLVEHVRARGRLVVVGASPEPIRVDITQLIFGTRSVEGSLTGTATDIQDTLAFSAFAQVRPMIETLPLQRAAEAYARMMEGEARFRMVLVTGQ